MLTKEEEKDFLKCAGVWLWGRYELFTHQIPRGLSKCDINANFFKLSYIGMQDSASEMHLIIKNSLPSSFYSKQL